eukprot:Nitzschia sp. Nitz4//scaffold18_size181773//130407//131288//NITZ4_001932-RA/size181773-snap-gene-0.278-mRNA-1//-1//CDS//3329540062//1809//frame0
MSNSDNATTPEPAGSLLKQTLMNVDECFVYRVPPLATSGGHRAELWDLANPLQTCGFQVERRDNDLYLLFTTDNHTKLFALAKMHGEGAAKSIEGVMDSSRYFVTRIQNNAGKQALIGFGFRDRDVAIDLLGNLQQFQKSIQMEIQAKNMKVTEIPTLAAGEKMHISIGSKTKSKIVKDDATKKSSGGPILLKKPPKPGNVASTTPDEESPSSLHLSMNELSIAADHHSVASEASDEAHAIGGDGGENDLDDDDWDDFQQA